MSYPDPAYGPPQPERPRRLRRGLLTVALAALVPGALLGWVAYEAAGSSGGDPERAAAPPSAGGPAQPKESPPPSSGSPDRDGGRPSTPASSTPSSSAPAVSGPLKGKVVVIDPGHNPGNFRHTAEINRKVDVGTHVKECDTTGTATNDGYTEARFTLDLAHRLRALLEAQGATVKLTHDNGSPPWGPCVDERARIGNAARADAAVSLHADGSAPGNRGFHVILPGAVHAGAADTRPIVAASRELGERIAGNLVRATGQGPSNYIGNGTGLVTRKDLGGLNLSTVPKVFVECGNMRDSKDAALLTSGDWRQKAAEGISEGIVGFLRGS
ncbi:MULTISPECIES: N-acetylmuramoyl-L-alanine amidase [Streptomyces]|uniref:N-acetylmuramoyl-L-alanine amidase n=1 Tax=Streptomyces TaxID=1883 RepID=UPI000A36FE2A|nr:MULTISPECIES: N-acetylmuramoyl-L-alanine amidase [Streptomyces]MDN5383028.1 N-acetylmuramoyl-L-alanine amidase [Streptomyces sp. LB8]